MTEALDLHHCRIAAVIPAYRVEREIEAVIQGLPDFIDHIIVVDDASPDQTAQLVEQISRRERRVVLLRHDKNRGVGGAMVTGFRKALELDAQIVVKIDGDGQMDARHLATLLTPLVRGQADYAKGNRFRDFVALRQMPLIRRIGNMGLGFLTKVATGYWNVFDPTNGYVAIRAEVLAQLPLDRVDNTYFFETSMLANLYLLGAVVKEMPMPAQYRDEVSSMVIHRVLLEFPLKLTLTFLRRVWIKNFIYDFTMLSIYLLTGLPLLAFGLVFGITKWIIYARQNIPAPTGTVMLPTLAVILGIQILLSAIELDLQSVPKEPLSKPLDP